MKQLFFALSLLSFCNVLAFEYNPIQQAIVDRDPDTLVKLLETTPLTFAEKKAYLDLAEQVILDHFLLPMQQAFKPQATDDMQIAACALVASFVGMFGSVACVIHCIENDRSEAGALAMFCASCVTLLGSSLYFTIANMQLQSIKHADSIKIKQILLNA